MGGAYNRYRLKEVVAKRLRSEDFSLVCERCGKSIGVGEVVVSRCSGKYRKFYHADCWREMFIEV